jgi:uncharacterized protein (DUF2344 family)
MTFSPALSLGVMSLGEVLDIKLTCEGDPSSWLDALTAGAPDGLRFVEARRLGREDASISKVVDTAFYAVAFPRSTVDDGHARARVAECLAAEALPVVRNIDGVGKKVDVRRYLRQLSWDDVRAHEAIDRAGLVGDLVTAYAEVAVTPQGSCKIGEVVEVLFGAATPYKAVRSSLARKTTSPLALEALREDAVETANSLLA